MSVKIRINGREFVLDWSEFMTLRTPYCVDILEIREKSGVVYA